MSDDTDVMPSNDVDIASDMETQDVVPEYYYDERRNRYWHRADDGAWVDKSEVQLRRWLKQRGMSGHADPQKGQVVSKVEELLIDSETNKRIFYAGPLAGYHPGLHDMEGGRVLVTRGPRLLDPRPGEWPTLARLIDNLMVSAEDKVDQRPYLYGWLRQVLESLYSGWWSRGLCMVLAGDAGCGKSLLLELIKVMTGNRIAKPYRYMIGVDNFNEEMFEATLLAIDDENADTNIKSRRNFAAQIKQVVANSEARCRGMHQKAMTLKPLWRLVVCTNLEPDNLLVLPPVDEDIADKLMLLKAYHRPMPMPTSNETEKRAFYRRLMDELPSFVHWLLHDWQLPSELGGQDVRFGVRHFHHPEILNVLDDMSPFERLRQLIEQVVIKDTWYWKGTTSELEHALKDPDNGLMRDDRSWVPQPAWLGRHLERLSKKYGEQRYHMERQARGRVWHIFREDYPHEKK
jgi:energy-coupling factor transporter ATP-binding protein EcfA2